MYNNKLLSIKNALEFSVNAFKTSWLLFFITFIMAVPINIFLNFQIQFLDSELSNITDKSALLNSGFILNLAAALVLLCVWFYTRAIIIKLAFRLYDRRNYTVQELVWPNLQLINYFAVEFLIYILLMASSYLFLSISVLLMVLFGFAKYDVLYKNSSIFNAFQNSLLISRIFAFPLFLFQLVFVLIQCGLLKYFPVSAFLITLSNIINIILVIALGYLYRFLAKQIKNQNYTARF